MELFLVVRRGRSTWTCWAFAFDIPHPLLNLDEKPVQTLAVTTGRSAQKVTQVEMICQTTLSICASRQIKALCPHLLPGFSQPEQTEYFAVCNSHCRQPSGLFVESPQSLKRWLRHILLRLLASSVWRPASRSGLSFSQLLHCLPYWLLSQ